MKQVEDNKQRAKLIRAHRCLVDGCGQPTNASGNRPQARLCPRCQEMAEGRPPDWPQWRANR